MTAIVAVAMPLRVLTPTMYMPAIAIATVAPEMTTVRPEVRNVVSSASSIGRAALAFCARADDEEERVVDADRHPDQQHHRLGAVLDRKQLAERSEQAEARGDGAQREHDRNERRDQRPEREQEHEQRDRDREQLRAVQVAVDGPVSRLVGGDIARLLDRQLWVCVRRGRHCRADSSDVDVARELHGDDGGASVERKP